MMRNFKGKIQAGTYKETSGICKNLKEVNFFHFNNEMAYAKQGPHCARPVSLDLMKGAADGAHFIGLMKITKISKNF